MEDWVFMKFCDISNQSWLAQTIFDYLELYELSDQKLFQLSRALLMIESFFDHS